MIVIVIPREHTRYRSNLLSRPRRIYRFTITGFKTYIVLSEMLCSIVLHVAAVAVSCNVLKITRDRFMITSNYR